MDNEIKGRIIEVAKNMYDKKMVNAFEGNISIKEGEKVYITPSGVCKGYLTEEMITIVDEAGNVIEGDHAPSSELKLHLAVYRLRKDVKSVIHNHSAFATAYAIANKPIESLAYPEMIIAFDKIPVVKYGTPSTDEVHSGLSEYIFNTDVFLLANHGIVSIGSDIYDAYYKIEAAESVAKTLTIAQFLGGEAQLPNEKIEILYKIRKDKFGRDRMK